MIGASRSDAAAVAADSAADSAAVAVAVAVDAGAVVDGVVEVASDDAGVAAAAGTGSDGARSSPDRRVRMLAVAAAVLLVLPVFLHVNGWYVGLGQSNRAGLRSPGVTVPLNTLAVAAMVAVSAFWSAVPLARVPRRRVGLLGAFVVAQLAACGWGTLHPASEGAWSLGALYLVQSLVPLTAFVLFYRLAATEGLPVIRIVATTAALVLGAVCALLLVATVVAGTDPLTGFHGALGPFVISKGARFFPTAVSVFAGWSLATAWRQRSAVHAVAGVAGLGVLVIGHSRTALLIGLVLTAATAVRLVSGRRRIALTGALLVTGTVLVIGVLQLEPTPDGEGSALLRSASRMADVVQANTDNQNRLAAITGSLRTGLSRPFGNAYQATEELGTNGRPTAVARVAVSENLYGEFAARSGPLGLATFVAILVVALRSAASLRVRRESEPLASAWLAPALVLLVPLGGLTQLNATEFYIAPVSWGLMGLAIGVADHVRRLARDAAAEGR